MATPVGHLPLTAGRVTDLRSRSRTHATLGGYADSAGSRDVDSHGHTCSHARTDGNAGSDRHPLTDRDDVLPT